MINRPDGVDTCAATSAQYARKSRIQPVELCLYSGRVLTVIRQTVNRIRLPPRNGKRSRLPAVNLCAQFVYGHTAPPIRHNRVGGRAPAG